MGEPWCYPPYGRASWDLMALMYAVRGEEGLYWREFGKIAVDVATGDNSWVAAPWGVVTQQSYLVLPTPIDQSLRTITWKLEELLKPLPKLRPPPAPPSSPHPPLPP
eukprot:605627-Prymnesium_polylepis.1